MLALRTAVRKVERLAYSPDGTRLAVGGPTGTEVIEADGGETVAMLGWARNCSAAFGRTEDRLFLASRNRQVAVVNLANLLGPPEPHPDLYGVSYRLHDIQLLPASDGWLADGSDRYEVVRGTYGFPPPHTPCWSSLAHHSTFRTQVFHAFGDPLRVALLRTEVAEGGDHNKYLYLLDGDTGELIRRHRCGYGSVDHFTGSPCGGYLVGVRQATLVVWDTAALHWPPQRWANDSRKQFTGVAFHPHGRYLLTASNDKSVKLWDLTCGQVVRSYDWSAGRMRSVAVAPDGLTAAAGSDENLVVLFDLDL